MSSLSPSFPPSFDSPAQDDHALLLAALGINEPASQAAVQAGYRVLAQFLEAFNAHDPQRWATTLNYPHVRLASRQVQVWQTAADYAASNDLQEFAATGWAYSRWDWIKPVQAGPDKVHLAVQFTRYDAAHGALKTFQALYVVTLQDGHWGIQSRSSYAGIALPGAAF